MVELILFGTFIVLLFLSVPVAFALGLAAAAALFFSGGIDELAIIPSVMFAPLSSETLLAIPFFILAGTIMEYAGISQRLIAFANAVIGHRKHGLSMVVIIAAFFFSAISGSGPATVAALGTILIPALIRNGYEKRHAAALMATAGSMGIIVPPSITFIIFAVVAGEYMRISIGRLFMAGIVPGILMAIALFIASTFIPRTTPAGLVGAAPKSRVKQLVTNGGPAGMGSVTSGRPADEGSDQVQGGGQDVTMVSHIGTRSSGKEIVGAFVGAIPGLMVPVIILGGIYGGIFTPTESAVVSSFYALAVGFWIYRDLKVSQLPRLMVKAALQSSVVMLIVASATVFAYVITRNQTADAIGAAILGMTDNKFLIILSITILLLIVGAFVDAISAFYLFIPILLPVMLSIGMDITTIGVMMTVNLAVGLYTPPVGVNLFVAAGISGSSLSEVAGGVWRFLVAAIVVLLLVTYIPELSNWLPDLLGV